MKKVIEGSWAAAWGARLAKAKVIAAYPITPQTHIVEKLAEWIDSGEMEAEMIRVEGEHSALSAVVGAATRVRTFTATCSQGLLYMSEILWIASGMRLPIVMAIANRALSAPINIWNDWCDSMAVRDSGWLQFYAENPQEILNMILLAYKVSEDVLLPSMVCFDGYILSHVFEPVEIPEQEKVDKFLGEYNYPYKLDPKNPLTLGPVGTPDYYFEFKYYQWKAMEEAKEKIKEYSKEFEEKIMEYGDPLIEVLNEDSKTAIVTMGSLAGTLKHMILKDGEDFCLVKLKVFRPFPREEIRKVLENKDRIIILEKAISFGQKGPLAVEVESSIEREVLDVICGLGGRDVRRKDIKSILGSEKKKGIEFLGLKISSQ